MLIFCIACRLSSVLSYFNSMQVLAHLNHLYPATKLDTYLHCVFDQISFVKPWYNMNTARSYEDEILELEEKIRPENRTAGSEPREETTITSVQSSKKSTNRRKSATDRRKSTKT